MSDNKDVPTVPTIAESRELESLRPQMAPALRIMLDERIYNRIKQLATLMAQDTVFTPKHLIAKPAACFTVIQMAISHNIDPAFLARGTYQTPGGSIGFEGKLIQAILEQSGRFIGAPKVTYVGEWSKVFGKFEKKTTQHGNQFIVPTWTMKDAEGLGVIVSWQVKGESEPRYWPSEAQPFYLAQCFPLNSPLWASDPQTQLRYLSLRRFADNAAPGILGGMPFDVDELVGASERARDVTPPRPTRENFGTGESVTDVSIEDETDEHPAEPLVIYDHAGDSIEEYTVDVAAERFRNALKASVQARGEAGMDAVIENNLPFFAQLRQLGLDALCKEFEGDIAAFRKAPNGAVTQQRQPPQEHPAPRRAGTAERERVWTEGSDSQQQQTNALIGAGNAACQRGTAELNTWWEGLSSQQRGLLGARGRGTGAYYQGWLAQAREADGVPNSGTAISEPNPGEEGGETADEADRHPTEESESAKRDAPTEPHLSLPPALPRGKSAIWGDDQYRIDIPTIPGHTARRDDKAYALALATLIADAPTQEALDNFLKENNVGLRWLADIGSAEEVREAVRKRRGEDHPIKTHRS